MSEHGAIGPVAWVLDDEDLGHLLAILELSEECALDLETTGLEEHAFTRGPLNGGVAGRIVLASFTVPPAEGAVEPCTWLLPLSHPESPFLGRWREVYGQVAEVLLDARVGLIAHNAVFDLRWTHAHTGVDLSGLLDWDTQMSSHLLDENRSTRLKERAPATFGVRRWDDFDLSYPGAAEQVPLIPLGEYAARDTYWTWRLAQVHRRTLYIAQDDAGPQGPDEIEHARLGRLARWVAMPTVANIARMEQRGLVADDEWIRRELADHEQARDVALKQMAARFVVEGTPTVAATSKWFKAWTETACAVGALRVTAMTDSGAPQWSKAVLRRLAREGYDAAQTILDVRGHTKMAEYLASWLAYLTPAGTIHPRYHAGRVVTGRLSSSNPNAQQITKALKPAFVPREGRVLAEIDYSQIELRVAAHVSGCQPMIDAFNRGDDLHRLLAARIAHKDPADVTPEERQKGKSANFGLLYGMGAPGFQQYAEDAYGVAMSPQEAEAVHAAFFAQWEGMAAWHARQARRAQVTGQVTSPIGRIRRLPDIFDGDPATAAHAERNAINSPVQGFASDLMQMASASIQGLLPGSAPVAGAYVVATVHDSIVVEVPADRWEPVTRACIARMTDGVLTVLRGLDCDLTVPLAAEATVATRWGLADVGTLA